MNKRPSGLKIPSKIARPTAANQSSRASSPTNSHSGISQNTDDFIVGDRIWVGGNKPGHIQFIGETKFAPGEWAGIVLDEPIGKNDGSMGGTRYFMCEPKRGIFSRLSKLTRESTNGPSRDSQNSSIMTERSSTPNRASSPDADRSSMSSSTRRAVSPIDGTTRTTKQTKRVSASPNTGGQVLTTTTTTTVKHDAQPVAGGGVKIGDRVLVGGTKAGVLRYIGTADFADGSWCGVELDEPLGKNDGTVAGKKYFDCKTKYGLFAQTHKVSKQPGSSTVTRVVRTTRVASNSPTPLSKRSGSQESLGSMSSTSQRSTLGSRVRLGVTSLTSPGQKSGRPQAANVTATTTALQESLRQKEQHIEQLLKEREMERSEISRAAAQVDAVIKPIVNSKIVSPASNKLYTFDVVMVIQTVVRVHRMTVLLAFHRFYRPKVCLTRPETRKSVTFLDKPKIIDIPGIFNNNFDLKKQVPVNNTEFNKIFNSCRENFRGSRHVSDETDSLLGFESFGSGHFKPEVDIGANPLDRGSAGDVEIFGRPEPLTIDEGVALGSQPIRKKLEREVEITEMPPTDINSNFVHKPETHIEENPMDRVSVGDVEVFDTSTRPNSGHFERLTVEEGVALGSQPIGSVSEREVEMPDGVETSDLAPTATNLLPKPTAEYRKNRLKSMNIIRANRSTSWHS